MSSADAMSDVDFPLEPIMLDGPTPSVWLDGDVLACACPQCGAPMSIRLWLCLADCFRCGASVELTAQQEAEAERLLRQADAGVSPSATGGLPSATGGLSSSAGPHPAATASDLPSGEVKRPSATGGLPSGAGVVKRDGQVRPHPAATASDLPSGEVKRPSASVGVTHRRIDVPADATVAPPVGGRSAADEWDERAGAGWIEALPAYLVSLVVHLVVLLLLSLWVVRPPEDDIELTLATTIDAIDIPGNQSDDDSPRPRDFEDPGGVEMISVIETPGFAPEETVEPPVVDVPVRISDTIGDAPQRMLRDDEPRAAVPAGRMFAGRDPEAKQHLLRHYGGTTETEAAVARGLEWLARRQNADGSWSLHAFHKSPGAEGKGDGMGSVRSDSAGTGLALLPMLGAGNDHVRAGPYRQTVSDGLRWLVNAQRDDGDLRGPDRGDMYAHGISAIALCEAYALSGDEQLHAPARAAVDFIVDAQHGAGGWRYSPGQPGDTSVLGWQWMALQSAKMAGLNVPSPTLAAAAEYLDRAQTDRIGGRYSYQPGRPPTHVMTAEALLCRQYQGWSRGHEGLRDGASYLLAEYPPSADEPNIYFWYYATQVMHHLGGSRWQRWNARMRNTLLETQVQNGHEAGSWAPRGGFAHRGGRLYMTALALCTLEVYYRHMPLYQDVQAAAR